MPALDIVWESYHSDGRPRNTPLPSTVHGWLTKMRGTIFDNETIRYQGIREMKQAAAVRLHRRKEADELRLRNRTRAKSGRPPLKPAAKQPLLRLSFLRNRPKPIAGTSYRPAATTRKSSSGHTQKRKRTYSSSKSRHSTSSGKRSSKRPHPSKKSSHASHASKRSSRK